MSVTAVAQRKEAKRVGAEHGQADLADGKAVRRCTCRSHPVRFVTAAALFDGHDAAINIMRRILQAQGAEVIHLGHDRSVRQVVDAVLEEDAQGVAVSSYQGGHVEYFEYLAASLSAAGAGHVQDLRRRRRRHRARGDRPAQRGRGADLLAGGRPAARPARHDQRADPRLRHRPGRAGRRAPRRCSRATGARSPGPSPACRRAACPTPTGSALTAAAGAPPGPGPRHHRHRRLRQVVADRRAGPPVPHRPARQAAGRGARGRPDQAARRRRAARRPDPDERARRRPRVLPLAGHPGRPRAAGEHRRRSSPPARRPATTW